MSSLIQGKLRTMAALALAGMLALGSLGAAMASPDAQSSQAKQGLFGTVTAKTEDSLTLKTKSGQEVELELRQDTKVRIPGEAEASIEDVPVGSRVAVLAQGEADARTALSLMVVPGQPQHQHRVLTVVDVTGNLVVAEDSEGNRVEVELDHQVSEEIKGQLVTFIAQRSQQSNRFKAKAEVKISQIIQRLEAEAEGLEARLRAEADARVKAQQEQHLAQLKARLEVNMQRHLDLFAEIIAKAPEQAKASLEVALQNTLQGYRTALEVLGDAEVRLNLRTTQGSVQSVDSTAGQITIRTRGGALMTLKVTSDTRVFVGEEQGTLADLSTGALVRVRYNSETSEATEIRVRTEMEAEGVIQSVDTENNQITIQLEDGSILALNLNSEARVRINDTEASLADLQPNMRVQVEYDLRSMNVLEIKAETEARVEGTVKDVNTAQGTVTILLEDGQELTLNMAEGTRVNIRGLLFGLLRISPGMVVEARYDSATGRLLELKAEAEGRSGSHVERQAFGTVTAVDQGSGQVIVQLDSGAILTLTVDSSTEVQVNGRTVALTELQAGSRVRVEYNPETKVASRIRAEAQARGVGTAKVSGTLESVNPASGLIVIALDNGTRINLRSTDQTQLLLDGSVANLLSLMAQVGSRVEVEYDQSSQTALKLEVEAESQGQVDSSSTVSGTIQAVDAASGTISVVTDAGEALVLRVNSQTQLLIEGAAATLASLAAHIGAEARIRYNTQTRVASLVEVQGDGEANAVVTASGALKAVNLIAGTVTIATQGGTDLVLKVTSDTKVLVNGSSVALASLLNRLGSQATIEYTADAMVATSINVQG